MVVPWAKTAVPRVPPLHVSRPRLLAALDGASPGQLVLVTAPAGYGKTSLLAEWVATREDRVAWVSLDDDDATAHRFWSAVLAALAACPAVPAGALPGPAGTDPAFLRDLVTALAAVAAPIALVLDDVHELTEPAPVGALAALVRERPEALLLVLASRTDPPVSIARLRLAGQLREIRAADLAFSTAEARALLDGAAVPVGPGHVRLLVDQTEGWAAGLRLAAMSLRAAPDADRFLADLMGNSKATSDYLVGEILSRLAPDVRDLLHRVSVCDQLTAGLAATLAERPDAGDVLAALEDGTALVQSSGEGRTSYRIHPLLRAHLRADLGRRLPELVDRLHARASDWFAARDQAVPALAHARRAGDPGRVRALLERHVTALIAGGDHAAARDAVRFLSEPGDGEGPGDPFVELVEALVAAETGAAAEVARHLTRAERAWPPAPPEALDALRVLVRSRSAGMVGDPARMVRVAAEVAAVGPHADPELVAMGRLDSALTALASRRVGEARRLAEGVLADAREQDQGYLVARTLAVLAVIAAAEGDYGRTAELGDRAAAELARGPWQATAGAGLLTAVRAYAALLDLHPVRCLALLGPPQPAGAGTDALDPLGDALRAAALADLDRGPEAVPELRAAVNALAAGPAPPPLFAIAALLVHGAGVDLGQHDVTAEVERLTEDVLGPTGDVVLMRARRTGAGSPPDPAALRAVADGTTPAVVNWVPIEARIVLGDLALADGRPARARHELDRALRAGATGGALRPLLAGGPAVLDLLAHQLGSFGAGDAAAARVLEFRAGGRGEEPPLTDRERDVLTLLGTPRSLEEIADRLGVAPSTVKTHLRAVYAKLDVTSRREAVVAGRRRGVVG